jgi:arylsulfatase A-like enzyme
MKLYENTLIIVTADHGENFGEHGLAYHLFCLYDTLIRVPLVFHAPALFRGPIRVPHLVSLTDVLPTLLDILRIDSNRRREIDGRSLLPFDGRPYHSHIFSEFDRPTWMLKNLATRFAGCDFSHLGRGLRCVRTAEHKLIVGSDGRQELYHLPSDPGETRNLIEQNPEQANILQRTLEDWLASFKMAEVAVPPKEDDALILKNLRDLGYV